MSAAERLRIVVSGMVAGVPAQGGASWAVLQYVLGLRELGHEVRLVEPVPNGEARLRDSAAARYFEALGPLVSEADALLATGSTETVGAAYAELAEFAAGADLLLNISGMLRDPRLSEAIPVRAFLDLDPGFNQVWQLTGHEMGFDRHTHFLSVGLALGTPECAVPTCGLRWTPTLPPVVLSRWPRAPAGGDAFTSVGNWRSYGAIEYGGIRYGQRVHSLRELISLPRRSGARLRLALAIDAAETGDLAALREHGWELVDPAEHAATPGRYAEFICGSKGELGVAKSGYVASRSGWFSDRSACYLASGRPVVAQETGFGRFLPTGDGLLSFRSEEDAAEALERVEADWSHHSAAARELAEAHLDSRRVLSRMLDCLASAP